MSEVEITDAMVVEARATHKAFVEACIKAGHGSYREEDAWCAALRAVAPMIAAATEQRVNSTDFGIRARAALKDTQ